MPRGQPGTPIDLRESRLLSEYLALKYPGARVVLQPRLGAVPAHLQDAGLSSSELRMLGVWRRYPDAVILEPNLVTVVEACLKPDPGKISIIELYASLFPQTVEFEQFRSLPVSMLLVWAVPDEAVAAMARQRGIRVDIFQPTWVLDWLETLYARHRRAATVAVA